MRYSVQLSDQINVKGYRFLSFAKSMGKNICKNISKSLSGKYSPGMLAMRQKLLDHVKQSAEKTGDLFGNKITDAVRSKTLATRAT